ncbi:MAG TPA: LuxR C-terminal-related transcriptional regulator, partial [Plasticicumulans sp.]
AELGLTESTIEVHRRNLMHKLGAGTLTELVQLHVAASTNGTDPRTPYHALDLWMPPRRPADDG